jgi:hypothetical protein
LLNVKTSLGILFVRSRFNTGNGQAIEMWAFRLVTKPAFFSDSRRQKVVNPTIPLQYDFLRMQCSAIGAAAE